MTKKLVSYNRKCPCSQPAVEISRGVPRCANCREIEERLGRRNRQGQLAYGFTQRFDKYTNCFSVTIAGWNPSL